MFLICHAHPERDLTTKKAYKLCKLVTNSLPKCEKGLQIRYSGGMKLLTLGGLRLEGADFTRVKPLLLLAYLALEGPKERRYLAELFWPGASNHLNSLSAALSRLRKGAPGALEADELRVWPTLTSDVIDLLGALERGDAARALALYRGAFLEGIYLSDWSPELEEWVYASREGLAARVQHAALQLAEKGAAQGRFAEAAEHAEHAFTLPGAPESEPEELSRFYLLLQAGEHPLAAHLKTEAQGYGVTLSFAPVEAKARLQHLLVGRESEAARLSTLEPGECAWVCGGAGIGKTALLKSLHGSYLPGRTGLPYATLEPLLGTALQEGEGAALQALAAMDGVWLIDNWERVDAPSQALLGKLRDLRPKARLIIASRDNAPAETMHVDMRLELSPLSERALQNHTGAWEHTQGVPALVEAFLRGEPPAKALEAQLSALSATAGEVYLTLALLDDADPDTALVRRALKLDAKEMAQALEALLAAGLVEPSGKVRVRRVALEFLEAHPTRLGPLSLQLARCLEGVAAFPLYERSRPLWTREDEAKVVGAYLAWAEELLRRGFAQRAFETLEDAPDVRLVTFLKGRALERSGRYREAFACIEKLVQTPEVLALRATLHYRLGHPKEAKRSAEVALKGSIEARAEGQNVLGNVAFSRGHYDEAAKLFRRAAALWLAVGQRTRWVGALNNAAVARSNAGEDAEEAYGEALAAAGANQELRTIVLINLGCVYEDRKEFAKAVEIYENVIALANETKATATLTTAWNNIGDCYKQEQPDKAREAYKRAYEFAQKAGDSYMIATTLANLAELSNDFEAWQEAMYLFEVAGHMGKVEKFQSQLPENHLFRVRSGVGV